MTLMAYQEVTEWVGDIKPNHIYLLSDDKMFAYIREGTDQAQYFKNPITISKKGRKFVKLFENPFSMSFVSGYEQPKSLVEVIGSKGDVYYVDPVAKTCTCSGFKFRNKCSHIDKVK